MPSPPALSYDCVYHIYNRGINRENIFIERRNYPFFQLLLEKHIVPTAEIYAFCLLKNHFHLLVRILPSESLIESGISSTPSQRFSNFFNAYAKVINHTYDRVGSLFQHPFGRVLIKTDSQLMQTVRYIHRNPLNHGFVDDFQDWPHSSYEILLSTEESFLARATVLEYFGGREEFIRFHEDEEKNIVGTLQISAI